MPEITYQTLKAALEAANDRVTEGYVDRVAAKLGLTKPMPFVDFAEGSRIIRSANTIFSIYLGKEDVHEIEDFDFVERHGAYPGLSQEKHSMSVVRLYARELRELVNASQALLDQLDNEV